MIWSPVKLGAAAGLIRGVTFDRSEVTNTPRAGFTPILRAGNIGDGLDTGSDLVWVPNARVSPDQILRKGDIVIAMSSGSASVVGKIARLDHEWPGSAGAFCAIIRPKSETLSRYLGLWLRGPSFGAWRLSQCMGANIQNLRKSELENVVVPLPAPREQERIAVILDQADGLRRQREEAGRLADRILPALFHKMFGDPATNPKRWPRQRLGLLLDGIDSGWSPVCENRPAQPDEWGVLKLGAVTSNRYLDRENKALPPHEQPLPELEVKPGDLLFSRKNTRQLVGACAYVKATLPKLMLSDLVFRLRLKADAEINPLYLWALLITSGKRPAIEVLAGGSAGSMPNISKGRLETLEIEKPPKALQDQFARSVADLEALRGDMGTAHDNLENLFSVLLHRAFTGELTAKWREAHLNELLVEMEDQAKLLRSEDSAHG